LIDERGHVRSGPSADDFIQQCDEQNCYLLIEEIPAGKYQLIFSSTRRFTSRRAIY